jgi:hypothetical protein
MKIKRMMSRKMRSTLKVENGKVKKIRGMMGGKEGENKIKRALPKEELQH